MTKALHDCIRCHPGPNPGKFDLPRGKTRHRGLCGTCRRELRDAQSTARVIGLEPPTTLGPYVAPTRAAVVRRARSMKCKHRWTRWVPSFWQEYKHCLGCGTERSRVGRSAR